MTDEEMREMEEELSRTAHALQAEVEMLCKDLDHEDPDVKKLLNAVANVSLNIDAARELGQPDPILEKMRARHGDPKYTWENLPVYAWNNEFARVIGRLMAVLPKRLHVHTHNLAAQATLISNCIAMGHRDTAPGEVVPIEELRAFRTIGYQATFTAEQILNDLVDVTKAGAIDIKQGITLIQKMRLQFETDVNEVAERPQLVH